MTIFFVKSILSLLLLVPAGFAMYSMLSVFGRNPDVNRVASLKRIHRIAGYLFIALILLVSYLCIEFAIAARTEPSPRAALHILLALTIAVVFIVKALYVRLFRRLYEQAKTMGTVIGILSLVLVGISAGYFLLASRFGQDRTMDRSANYEFHGPFLGIRQVASPGINAIRTDKQSIERGRALFQSRCSACHDPNSTRTIVGPGLQGVLKKPKLPVSGNPATAESIRFQLKQPFGRMPSFAYLSDDEVEDIIAYLNTL